MKDSGLPHLRMTKGQGLPVGAKGNDKWPQILFGSHSREGGNP